MVEGSGVVEFLFYPKLIYIPVTISVRYSGLIFEQCFALELLFLGRQLGFITSSAVSSSGQTTAALTSRSGCWMTDYGMKTHQMNRPCRQRWSKYRPAHQEEKEWFERCLCLNTFDMFVIITFHLLQLGVIIIARKASNTDWYWNSFYSYVFICFSAYMFIPVLQKFKT